MTIILSLAAFINQNFWLPQITNITHEFFSSSRSITIISNDHSLWTINYQLPILIKNSNYSFPNDLLASGVLVDTSVEEETDFLNGIKWDSKTKFLMLRNGNCSSSIVGYFWQKNICNLLYISVINNKITICEDPKKSCYKSEPHVNQKELTNLKQINDLVLIPQLKDCHVQISFMDFPPSAISVNESCMEGFEGSILQAILRKLGSTITYKNRHEAEFGTLHPPTGILGDVLSGESLIGFGSLYPFAERFVKLDMLSMCTPGEIAWSVARGSGPRHPTSLLILISEFSADVWIWVCFGYLTFVTAFTLFDKHMKVKQFDKNYWLFGVLSITLGMPARVINNKTLAVTCFIYAYFITSIYKTMLSSKLTLPSKYPEITTLQQLANSENILTGPLTAGAMLKTHSDNGQNTVMTQLYDRFKETTRDGLSIMKDMVRDRNVAFMRHKTNMIYISLQNNETAGKIHTVEETINAYLPAALIAKHSCFLDRIRNVQLKLCEGGFASKLYNDALKTYAIKADGTLRKLSRTDLLGSFYVVSYGWLISGVVFFIENVMKRKFIWPKFQVDGTSHNE